MAGPGIQVCLGVIVRSLVLVFDEQSDGRAQRHAVFDPGLDADEVFLVALSIGYLCDPRTAGEVTYWTGQIALPGSSPAQLHLDVSIAQREALWPYQLECTSEEPCDSHRWTAVDDGSDRSTVAFAVRRHTEEGTKGRHAGGSDTCWQFIYQR